MLDVGAQWSRQRIIEPDQRALNRGVLELNLSLAGAMATQGYRRPLADKETHRKGEEDMFGKEVEDDRKRGNSERHLQFCIASSENGDGRFSFG